MKILIVGASTRAATYSALRAELKPVCADFFLDRDLTTVCDAHRICPNRPGHEIFADFLRFARSQNVTGWIYTGPFENQPETVDEISTKHPLWGNSGAILRDVRDPFQVSACLSQAELPYLDVRGSSADVEGDATWLTKPFASGGGLGIRAMTACAQSEHDGCYFQRQIIGRSYSGLFLGDSERSTLVGITRQFQGIAGNPFAYRGNIGPLVLPTETENQLRRIGDAIVSRFRLLGLFGVDFIVNGGQAWTLEINPRYTGAVEIHELAGMPPLLRLHRQVCESKSLDTSDMTRVLTQSPNGGFVAKWILYATGTFVFPDLPTRQESINDWFRIPEIADVPVAGLEIRKGDPVLTVFAAGSEPRECLLRLRSRIRHWRRKLSFVS